jgi:hypothetical protein
MLSTIDEGYGHLVGVTPLQLWIAVDINNRVSLAGIGADGSHLSNRLVAQMATLPGKYDDSLCPFSQLDHATIIHDAGDVSSEDRRDPRPIKLTASRPAPPTMESTETSRSTPRVAPTMSVVPTRPELDEGSS